MRAGSGALRRAHASTACGVRARRLGLHCRCRVAASRPSSICTASPTIATAAISVIDRFLRRGFNVIAYDSRAPRPLGRRSMHLRILRETGSAARARSSRRRARHPDRPFTRRARWRCRRPRSIAASRAVVAASTFADLRTIATERAPFVFTPSLIKAAFARAEHDARVHRRRGQPAARGGDDHGPRLHHPRRARSRDAARAFRTRLRGAARAEASC